MAACYKSFVGIWMLLESNVLFGLSYVMVRNNLHVNTWTNRILFQFVPIFEFLSTAAKSLLDLSDE